MVQIIEGDILTITNGIIGHQCNCKGKMGAGLALQVRNKYSKVYNEYLSMYKEGNLKLGVSQFVKVFSTLYVANLMGQHSFGQEGTHTDYKALTKCLQELHAFSQTNSLQVYLPYLIGCGLAGGDWSIVNGLIEKYCPDAIICKFIKDKQVECINVITPVIPESKTLGIKFEALNINTSGVLGKSDKPWKK